MGINVTKLFGFNQTPALKPFAAEAGHARSVGASTNPINNTQGLYEKVAAVPYERSPETRTDVLGQKLYCLG